MELLRSNLTRVRIPEPTNRIYKQECCITFDTPKSEGVDGGFDNHEAGYDETYCIVILPDYATLRFPSVELPKKVRLAVDAILMAEGAERKEQVASWMVDTKQISEHALNLQKIDNGVIVPPSGWKCTKCDKTENLWLNLTDGMILCGRRNWDGSGGSNHAIEHFNETGYPLAVKLGTIIADLEGAAGGGKSELQKILPNEDIVSQLAVKGFNQLHCQKAAINTSNAGVEEAITWLLSHMDDPDIDAPISQEAHTAEVFFDQSKVDTLVSFGFQEEIAQKALKASGGDIEKATDWIFSNDSAGSSGMDATSSTTTVDAALPDGGGKYRLIGLVSHIGTSTHCGHDVAHINKDRRWAIFNDEKVGASKDPPKDMGYLYFFERLDS